MPKIKKHIKTAYFDARKLRLRVLRELIVVYDRIAPHKDEHKMQKDGEVVYPEELGRIIDDCVQYIFSKSVTNICQSIQV